MRIVNRDLHRPELQRTNLLDADAPTPSVETLLHAFLPPVYVDHTHAGAVLALTDQPDAEALCREVLGREPGHAGATHLLAVLAQRLVRGLCEHCKEKVPNPAEVFEKLKLPLPEGDGPLQLWRGNGCPICKQTGYKGRRGIFELMVLDERFHDPIIHRAGAPEYQRLAREKGMRTMFEDGLMKAARGVTTVEEIMRETRLTPS